MLFIQSHFATTRGGASKSLTKLEVEELKRFMDLRFVFSDEDRDSNSRLASIIPGLMGKGGVKRRRRGRSSQILAHSVASTMAAAMNSAVSRNPTVGFSRINEEFGYSAGARNDGWRIFSTRRSGHNLMSSWSYRPFRGAIGEIG
ncbi:hypothetical protein SASPL_106047 [Salvia splendens]|uniref:Uncharacterized protein n=1 Tax=Salvia splendens TaxID=180675 RepID=A0A8X9AC55_SALSN|nr:hypothetical protein SASPL_106047 [Salvia splendens]